ncbi:MAG TPA: protein kinase [Thermoanaerobaculia bacterium]
MTFAAGSKPGPFEILTTLATAEGRGAFACLGYPQRPVMALKAGSRLGPYEILAPLGAGGMGEVYEAQDTRLARRVALKVLPEAVAGNAERQARFEREARAAAAINHPNIVTLYSIEEIDGVRFLTMELVEGDTLERGISGPGRSLEEILELAEPIAEALAAAHEKGIAHRDLKPGNVMVGSDGRVRVLDFGLARLYSGRVEDDATKAETLSALTEEGAILGTVPYMSPEQLRGEAADARSDIFSFGILLYELATGTHPFPGATPAETISMILRDEPPAASARNPGLPATLDSLIRRCLAKHPEQRPVSASDLREELRRLRGGAAPQALPSIAVLPFADMSPEHDQDYLCEGIAEEIINVLSRVEGLRVVSRMSSFQFKATGGDSREIGRRLGVRHLLEGSVRKAADRLRITAQLIETSGGYHVWSERFDRKLEDIFAIQDEIAESTARAMRLQLAERAGPAAPKPNVEAYETYLRAWQFFHRLGPKNVSHARQLLRRATEIDPGYARAWAAIAEVTSFYYQWHGSDPADLDEADAASRRALTLDPESAEAHAARAMVASLRGDRTGAREEFEKAVTADPGRYETLYEFARFCVLEGRREEAARYFERAAAVRPEEYQCKFLAGQTYEELGRREEMLSACQRGLDAARKNLELNPDDVRALYLGASALRRIGRSEEGLEWSRRVRELEPENPTVWYATACFLSQIGDKDGALASLEHAISHDFGQRAWIERDPDLASLRGDPRFEAILARMPAPPRR